MKLTQAEIDALFAEYSTNPDALEKANQNAGQRAAEEAPDASAGQGAAQGTQDAPAGAAAASAPGPDAKTESSPSLAAHPPKGERPQAPASQAAAPATFPSLRPTPVQFRENPTLGVLASVDLDVSVSLGHTRKSIREILSLGPGSVLELDTLAGEPVDIEVNGRVVARGEVVVVGENYGVRISELVSPDGGQAG